MATTMTTPQVESTLKTIPLEIRYRIFDHAAARDIKPKKVLRYWFEKKEVKELIAEEAASNPSVTPRVVYNNEEGEYDSEAAEQENEVDEEEGDSEDEDAENEEDSENDDEDGEQDAEDDEYGAEGDTMDNEQDEEAAAETEDISENTTAEAQHEDQDQDAVMDDNENAQTEEANEGEDQAMDDGEDQEAEGEAAPDDNSNPATATAQTTQTAPPPPPVRVIKPDRKWRHIPKFMRITHCPPPLELLLVSKQLNDEAKDWFYDVAILKIDATASFSHTSFFEEAFNQITKAAFSPMENIRKVEVTFVWDSTWIRAEETGFAGAIFPAMLDGRANFVCDILKQAPDLREVLIHWHDSAQDADSAILKLDILEKFYALNADIKVEEHYIASDAKPHSKSIAGQRRVEFQAIADAGFDQLN